MNDLYTPCSPSDVGAFKMTLHEVPEPDKLNPPDVDFNDYMTSLSKIKPTVSEKDLEKQEEFTRDFGQEGS
jgi:vacuolar protein-sorting-associated protein 4